MMRGFCRIWSSSGVSEHDILDNRPGTIMLPSP